MVTMGPQNFRDIIMACRSLSEHSYPDIHSHPDRVVSVARVIRSDSVMNNNSSGMAERVALMLGSCACTLCATPYRVSILSASSLEHLYLRSFPAGVHELLFAPMAVGRNLEVQGQPV